MESRKNLYLLLGTLLVIINLAVDIVEFNDTIGRVFEGDAFNIGYFIGSHFLLIMGIVFLRWGFRLKKKLQNQALEKEVNEIGKTP